MARGGARREQRHAQGSGTRRALLSWVPEVLVVLVVLGALGNTWYDLGHRWFGLERSDPVAHPAKVLPPLGLDLVAGEQAPPVATR